MTATVPPHFEEDTNRIMEAIAHAAVHDNQAALRELLPVIKRGPIATLAMLAALAEMAVWDMRTPDTFLGLVVQTTAGASASADDLPTGVRFAAQFTAAHANRDLDTARHLFDALLDADEQQQADNLAVAVRAVLDMAAASAREVIAKQRRGRTK